MSARDTLHSNIRISHFVRDAITGHRDIVHTPPMYIAVIVPKAQVSELVSDEVEMTGVEGLVTCAKLPQ